MMLPTLQNWPDTLPRDRAVELELVDGVIIFRASEYVQNRIETLLDQQDTQPLTAAEANELACYGEIDDYLSFVNRTIRNAAIAQNETAI
jgi:aconitase B